MVSIDDLSDVDTTTVAPTDGQALVWDNANSQWEPSTIAGGVTAIDDLSDVDTSTTPPTDGQVLRWNSVATVWEPQDLDEVIDGGNLETGTSAGDSSTVDGGVVT